MASARRVRRDTATLAFEALSIEGGLLSADWLARVAQLSAGGQDEAGYRIPKGLNLRDEIGRYWRMAQAHWGDFDAGRRAGADPATIANQFVQALLRDSFGFNSLGATEPTTIGGRTYPVRLVALGSRVPLVIAPAGVGLDSLAVAYGDGVRRRSAFGLTQEYLNAADGARWGLASDGCALRIVRDNASLTRPAWVEVDLARIFSEELYADFTALWLLAHETRFGRADQAVDDCALEMWRKAGRDEGTRAREHLRRGVEDALFALGQGFLTHPDNQALRAALQDGSLTTSDYFQQLLRLVYRLIFLLTIEERGLLHPEGSAQPARSLYADGYSIRRLRDRAVKRSAHDRFTDLWEATKIVFRSLAAGESALALPALSGIFARSHCETLDASKLENRALLLAVFRLSWLREDTGLARVNWRDMGPEELGSVYESLLELVPQITKEGRQFAFATGGETKGNARKTSGSYYTPDSLVQLLIDSALEPVVQAAISAHAADPVSAILELSIVDPACGSGHFLLAAARRLAAHVARLYANGTPSASEYRHALRQVVGRCVYGVDLNPMAVELCKVSLWMEAVEPGLPLTFLDSHIQQGNALLGTTPELMANGVPDAAWDPIEGDDKKVASLLKKRNKAAAAGQRGLSSLWSEPAGGESAAVAQAVAELEAASDADAEALARKESRWEEILGSNAYRQQKFIGDLWSAAFVWPKQPGALADSAPTNELWRQLRDKQGKSPVVTTRMTVELAKQHRFFHWHLQFPQVFAKGGFDVVLGNPPWDKIQPEEGKFFAASRPDIASAPSAKIRKALIAALPEEDPASHLAWQSYKRNVDGACHFLRTSGRLTFTGEGNLNSYRIFTEVAAALVAARGRVGLVAQTGLATDESGKELFDHLLRNGRLCQFLDFENRGNFFPDVHQQFRFCLITIKGRSADSAHRSAEFGWMLHELDELKIDGRLVRLTAEDLLLFNPSSRTSPVFTSARDVDVSRRIYRHGEHVMIDESHRFARVEFLGELFNMTRDSALFMQQRTEHSLPLYEAKFIHQFDHRYASAVEGDVVELTESEKQDPTRRIEPKSFVDDSIVTERARKREIHGGWMLGFRDIASATNERTAIASLIPFSAVGNSANLILGLSPGEASLFLANVNTFVFDFCVRQKISGSHVNIWIFKQLPAIPLHAYASRGDWLGIGQSTTSWIMSRVLELTYTAWDLEPFARDVGHNGTPFRWERERRFLLRCELDAAFFHLYRLLREDVDYVLDTFPIVRKDDEKAYGEYRTKRLILEIYDEMAEAAKTGRPYVTRLDPPPADPRVAHLDTRGGQQ